MNSLADQPHPPPPHLNVNGLLDLTTPIGYFGIKPLLSSSSSLLLLLELPEPSYNGLLGREF